MEKEDVETKVCGKCERDLPLNANYFEKRQNSKDGFRGVCRECRGGKFKISANINNGKKKCKCCNQWLDINEENFLKSNRTLDGYMTICKACHIGKHRGETKEGYKKCKKCNRELPLNSEYFLEDELCLDGFRNVCRECMGQSFGKRRDRKDWVDEEKEILLNNYPYMSNADIVEKFLPHRKETQIQNYATRVLNLKKDEGYLKERYWTKEMDDYLIKNYSDTDNKLLVDYLGKNEKTIVARAIKYNLKKENCYWTEGEIKLFVEKFSTMSNKELWEKYFSYRGYSSISIKASKMGLQKDKEYLHEMKVRMGFNNFKKVHGLKGELHPLYKERVELQCSYCGKSICRLESDIKNNDNTFCNQDCKGKWMSENMKGENNPSYGRGDEIWTDEMRRKKAELQIKALKNSDFSYRRTKPQITIDNLLDKLNITFENEYDCKYYLIDNYLTDYNLMIEVQGNFFHCNPVMQYKNSREGKILHKDKSKHTYIKKYKEIEVLYLWEKDINENEKLCEKLILEYINNNGILENYHSFNYYLNEEGELKLLDEKFIIGY